MDRRSCYWLPAPDDCTVESEVVLRRLFFFFDWVEESAGMLVTLESDELLELIASPLAALSASPLPPTAVPAGGWKEPRNCWIDGGMLPFG
jgi:hypothetical protein